MDDESVRALSRERRKERDRLRAAEKRAALTPAEKVSRAAYHRAWKAANPDKIAASRKRELAAFNAKKATDPAVRAASRAKSVKHAQRRGAEIDALKAKPCADCGVSYPPYVMDFDHRDPSTKSARVRRGGGGLRLFAARCSRSEFMAEVAKCDVVCSNCHRERTYGPRSRSRRSVVR